MDFTPKHFVKERKDAAACLEFGRATVFWQYQGDQQSEDEFWSLPVGAGREHTDYFE